VKAITWIVGGALVACGLALVVAAPAFAQAGGGQDKSVPLSKVERLNRAPVSKEILKVKLPQASTHKLANGMTVLILERHRLPTIALELEMEPGAIADPSPGLAKFTAEMLREGTAKRNSAAIAGATDEIGAQLNSAAEFGGSESSIYIAGLTDSTETMFDLLSDIVMHPSFPAEELEKYKKRQLGDLEDEMSRPYFLADKEFHKALYGDTNYAVTAPTPEQVNAVSPEMLAEYHHKYYVPGNAVLGIVGDVNTEDVMKLVGRRDEAGREIFRRVAEDGSAGSHAGRSSTASGKESRARGSAGIGADEYCCRKSRHQAERSGLLCVDGDGSYRGWRTERAAVPEPARGSWLYVRRV